MDFAYALDDGLRLHAGTGGALHDTRKRIDEVRTGIAPRIALGTATGLMLDAYYNRYHDQYLQQPRAGGGTTTDEETLDELWVGGAQLDHRVGSHRIALGFEAQPEPLDADRLDRRGERDRERRQRQHARCGECLRRIGVGLHRPHARTAGGGGECAFGADGDYGWYYYSGFCDKGNGLHHVSPRDVVYLLRGRDGNRWKLRMLAYYSDGGSPGHPRFEYAPVAAP